jgi:hypothetical protein
MPGIEQLADMHDSFVELLRTMDLRPLVERICMAVGIERERISAIRERSPAVAVMSFAHPARKTIGDIVLTVHDRNDRVLIVLIFEVQMSWDATKRWVWALLAVAFAHEARSEGLVAVFTPDPLVRERIRRRLWPKMSPPPLILDPDQVELICDIQRARARPREAIFGALDHARETAEPIDARVAGIRAAFIAARRLAPHEQLRYGALMQSITPPEIMERALADLPDDDDEPETDELPAIFREGYLFVTGRREGLAEGLAQGLAIQLETLRRVLVEILDTRGITIADADHRRIEQCEDVSTLARWCGVASSLSGRPGETSLAGLFESPQR